MSVVALIAIGVVAFVLFAAFRPVDPKSKTDDQLMFLYKKSLGSGSIGASDREALKSEMVRRGLLTDSNSEARTLSGEPYIDQLQATQLRQNATKAYEEGWTMVAGKWGGDIQRQHRHALTTVLLRRVQADPGAPSCYRGSHQYP